MGSVIEARPPCSGNSLCCHRCGWCLWFYENHIKEQAGTAISNTCLYLNPLVEPVISGSFSFVGLQPSRKRIRMAADWARVAVPWGSSVDSVTPVIMPSPQTHCIALIAYSLMDAKSL